MAKKKKHPSLDIVSSHGTELAGKKIVLCVAGSVAAYKSIEFARLLMRHGADVTCVVSDAASKLVKPDYFRWATGNDVITKLTGKLEHIQVADYGKSDLIIVYPATANTLGKLAAGIDDTPIATILTVGFGSKIPILIALAMHQSMYENIAVKKNINFLKDKVDFISPQMIEGKAKAAEPEDVLQYVLRKFGFSSILHDKKVLMTAGPTVEYIDPVRVITNQSTGKTGVLLAAELVASGAKVTLVYGPGREEPPKGAKVIRVDTAKAMFDAVRNELRKKFDIVILAAAVSDYVPEKVEKSKIKSEKKQVMVRLKQAPKIIDQIKKWQKGVFLVGFKAEANVSRQALLREARKKILESKADLIVANDVGLEYRKDPEKNNVLLVDSKNYIQTGWKKKNQISKIIRTEIEKRLKKTLD
ncbi:MAG: bifunctional phosphopantothenoylcysteine decarboxylase/phosphopantothenate--cysteine ligase CoaBC [Thaumarchaeota archaeon]|nr:bifunctional phosphopantothenoylcysteine decarboxylase/phosphopantothenate--cysteine ligase CoaBC [Nitrososphaerota archaeon]